MLYDTDIDGNKAINFVSYSMNIEAIKLYHINHICIILHVYHSRILKDICIVQHDCHDT